MEPVSFTRKQAIGALEVMGTGFIGEGFRQLMFAEPNPKYLVGFALCFLGVVDGLRRVWTGSNRRG